MNVISTIVLDPLRANEWALQILRGGRDVTNELREIRLAQEAGDGGIYILYINASGNEVDDLYYDTTEQALRHIEKEFPTVVWGDDVLEQPPCIPLTNTPSGA